MGTSTGRVLPVTAAVLGVVLAGCTSGPTSYDDEPGLGPIWSFTDIEGATHSRESAAGKPALLFFMATWCSSCQATAPRLADVHEDRGDSVGFYTISWDPQEDANDLRQWQDRYDNQWPHGTDPGSKVAQTFGITSQSSIVVLDASGGMVKRWIYAVPSVAAIQEALDEAGRRTA